jgi:hypothetical protein
LGSKIDKNSRSWPFETDLFVESFRVFSLLDFCFSPGLWLRGEVELLFFFEGRKQGENVPAQESFSKGWPSLARSLIYRASSSSFPFIKIFHGL